MRDPVVLVARLRPAQPVRSRSSAPRRRRRQARAGGAARGDGGQAGPASTRPPGATPRSTPRSWPTSACDAAAYHAGLRAAERERRARAVPGRTSSTSSSRPRPSAWASTSPTCGSCVHAAVDRLARLATTRRSAGPAATASPPLAVALLPPGGPRPAALLRRAAAADEEALRAGAPGRCGRADGPARARTCAPQEPGSRAPRSPAAVNLLEQAGAVDVDEHGACAWVEGAPAAAEAVREAPSRSAEAQVAGRSGPGSR